MLVFDPIAHSYKNEFTDEVYSSVSSLLNKLKKPFEADIIAERIAKKRKVTPEEIKAEWKQANDFSKTYGTELHAVIEQYNKTGTYDLQNVDIIQAYIDLNIIDVKRDSLLVEQQVYNHEFKLAGTADTIRLDEKGGFSVFDLKTNKKFNLFSPYNDYLLPPVEHLPMCEYSNYSLQLSFYAYMYQGMTGRKINQLGIFYYDRNSVKFTYYPVNYMKHDVITILNYFK